MANHSSRPRTVTNVTEIAAHRFLVAGSVVEHHLHEHLVGLCLGRIVGVWMVQKVVNRGQHLLDGGAGCPCFVPVEHAAINKRGGASGKAKAQGESRELQDASLHET